MAERVRRFPDVRTRTDANVVTIISFGENKEHIERVSGGNQSSTAQLQEQDRVGELILLATRRKNKFPKPPSPPGGSAA